MSPGKLCRPRVAYMRSLRPACASTIRSFFGNGEGRVNLNNYFLTAYVSRSWRSVEIARRSSRMRASARPDCTDIRASGRGLPGCGRAETNRKDGQGRHREGTTWRFAHRLSLSRSLQDEEGRSVDEEATSFDRARSPSHTRSRFATRAARVREQATRRGTAARESLCSPPRKAHRSRGMPACGARGCPHRELCGEQGIRTLGTLAGTPDFESGSFGHSDSSPPRTVPAPHRVVKMRSGRAMRAGPFSPPEARATPGEMTAWPKVHDWKSCVPARVPRVRIPLSPRR